jgi:hypothetical protein
MKKTFNQYDIEQKTWDIYLESKGYKKIKKKHECDCQKEETLPYMTFSKYLNSEERKNINKQ